MRKYKTFIIDVKKISKKLYVYLLGITVSIIGFYMFFTEYIPSNYLLKDYLPMEFKQQYDESNLKKIGDYALKLLLGFNPLEEESIIKSTVPVFASQDNKLVVVRNFNDEIKEPNDNIPEENKAPIKEVDISQKTNQKQRIVIGNETSYSVDIDGMLSQSLNIDMSKKGPKILITHTHATESYAPIGTKFYDKTASDRCDDINKNVVMVGKKMEEVFKKYKIGVIHDEILHDKPSFNGSYAHSLKTVEEYIEKYPSIQIVFDIHRDSIVYDDKTKAKPITRINNKNCAQLMLVVGTDENGLYHPNWKENMKTALHFQKAVIEKYPKLMRYVNLRKERFNGHTTNGSMIIEVGSSGNSIDEAVYAIELFSECVANLLISL